MTETPSRPIGPLPRQAEAFFSICPPSVPEIIDRSSPPLQLCSKVDLLAAKVREYVTETGHVAAGTRQVFNQPDADGIANANENDRQRGRMAFCSSLVPDETKRSTPRSNKA